MTTPIKHVQIPVIFNRENHEVEIGFDKIRNSKQFTKLRLLSELDELEKKMNSSS